MAGCVVYRLSKQRFFEISGTTHPTTQPHNPEYFTAIYKRNHTKHINIPCRQNTQFLNLKAGGHI